MPSPIQTGTSHSGSLFSALCSEFWRAFSPFSCFTTETTKGERMESRRKTDSEQFPGEDEKRVKIRQGSLAYKWREMFRRPRRKHDPMLVLNMSIFNFADGWDRTFNQPKIHENGA
jgi:hypothetical protein